MTCDDIYQKCMSNPYTVPAIPLDKCDAILERLKKTPNNDDRYRGAIIRYIWKNLHDSGWTGTPTGLLAKQFPDVKAHIEILRKEYDVITDMETAYLKHPYKVYAIDPHIINSSVIKKIGDNKFLIQCNYWCD